jgi:hypothetical protein
VGFFDVRRVRVRPRYAFLYPEVARDVWLSARRVARMVEVRGPRQLCRQQGCARGRVLCDAHFEFRGGRVSVGSMTIDWLPRAAPKVEATS